MQSLSITACMNLLEDMRENGKRCVLSARGGGPVLSGMFSEYLEKRFHDALNITY